MPRDEDAAVKAAAALFASEEEAETVDAAEQETPEGAASQDANVEDEPLFPEFEIELPEDLEEELTAPSAEDIQRELEESEEWEELDDDSRRLLARARHAEREAQFYRDQRLQSEKKNWVAEAEKFFPLSAPFLDEKEFTDANSRRGYLRLAKEKHEKVLPLVKPLTEKAKEEIAKAKAEAVQEERDEAKERWGAAPGSTATPTEASITMEQVQRNREKGDLASTIRAMIFPSKGD
jgi:hypothetical protein